MKVNPSFSKKIVMPASRQLLGEVAQFASLSACAGIKNSAAQARKARGNHYGEFITVDGRTRQIPVRQFVWAATHSRGTGDYTAEIVKLIQKGIHENPTPHTQITEVLYEYGTIQTGSRVMPGTAKHGTPVFAGRRGYTGLLEKIAKQMAINQYNAISELNIVGKKHNAESTKRRKGFDHPLEWTHKMENALEGWVARQ